MEMDGDGPRPCCSREAVEVSRQRPPGHGGNVARAWGACQSAAPYNTGLGISFSCTKPRSRACPPELWAPSAARRGGKGSLRLEAQRWSFGPQPRDSKMHLLGIQIRKPSKLTSCLALTDGGKLAAMHLHWQRQEQCTEAALAGKLALGVPLAQLEDAHQRLDWLG